MTGTFLQGERKTAPGSYYRRERAGYTTEGATNGVLACILQSNWGPLNEEFDVDQTMLNNLADYFGTGEEILREGLIGGATTIRAVRVGDGDGTCASVTLKGEVSTVTTTDHENEFTTTGTDAQEFDFPTGYTGGAFSAKSGTTDISDYITIADDKIKLAATAFTAEAIVDNKFTFGWVTTAIATSLQNAVTVSAKYPGSRAFTVSVRTNLITDKRQLFIYDGTSIFTSVSFDAGTDEAQGLVDALKTNRFFTATKILAAPLIDVTQEAMTGGTDPTVTAASYAKGTDVLERFRWNCVVADSDDSAVSGILTTFVSSSYETGHLGCACVAGKSTQDLEDRMSYAASCNDEKVVYVLNGWIGNDGTVYDGWLGAARIGGMIAASETNSSLTHTVIKNALSLIEPLTNGEIIRAEQRGCVVLTLNADDQIQIDNAINTLVTLTPELDDGWKKIRRTKCRFELMDRTNRTFDRLVGKLNNDSNGQATLVAAGQRIINEMIAEGKLVFGSYVELDPAHRPEGDSVWFKFHILDLDSVEKIYSTFVFRYGQTFDEN